MATPAWYNTNANRSYPFRNDAADLPDGVVVDAGFTAGTRAGFNVDEHSVYLARIRRQADLFFFDFESDAPELYGAVLTFTRHLTDPAYRVEFADSGQAGQSDSSLSYSGEACEEPLWSGFLVSGNMTDLDTFLPSGTADLGPTAAGIEPALIQTLARAAVTKLALANDDRGRVTAPDGCLDVVFPYDTGSVYPTAECLRGAIRFRPGYNATVRQSVAGNSITFGAAVGAGAGEPCDEVPLFDGEVAPDGSTLLEGGPRCNEVLRSVNGLGGRMLSIVGGTGVTVTSVPNTSTVVVAVDMTGLALCFDASQVSESC